MIVDDHTKLCGQERTGEGADLRAGGEVDHPQLVDPGSLIRLGGSAFHAASFEPLAVVAAQTQEAVHGGKRRECFALFARVTPPHFYGELRILFDQCNELRAHGLVDLARGSGVAAPFGMERLEAAFTIGVPPVLDGAHGIVAADFLLGPRARGDLAQRFGQADSGVDAIFESVDHPEAQKRDVIGGSGRIRIRIFHRLRSSPKAAMADKKTVMWDRGFERKSTLQSERSRSQSGVYPQGASFKQR